MVSSSFQCGIWELNVERLTIYQGMPTFSFMEMNNLQIVPLVEEMDAKACLMAAVDLITWEDWVLRHVL